MSSTESSADAGMSMISGARQHFALGLAVLTWGVLSLQLGLTVAAALESGVSLVAAVVRLFSFFTIQANLLVAAVYTAHARWAPGRPRQRLAGTRTGAATAVYITIVGVVYTILLRPLFNPQGLALFTDAMFHYAGPLIFVAFWLFFVRDGSLRWRDVLPWLAYPAAYGAYTLVRGAYLGWYPYPFLDAATLGHGMAVMNAGALLVVFWVVGLGVVALDRALPGRGVMGKGKG
jgi:hypothetical protein